MSNEQCVCAQPHIDYSKSEYKMCVTPLAGLNHVLILINGFLLFNHLCGHINSDEPASSRNLRMQHLFCTGV